MIDKNQRGQIRQLLQSPQWRTVEEIANNMISKIKEDTVVRNTEWDTLQAALLNEGQIRGIRNFIQELMLKSQDE